MDTAHDIEHPSRFAASAPDHPAVIVAGTGDTLTYAELEAGSNRVAHALRALGLGVGDHAAVVMGNRAEYSRSCGGRCGPADLVAFCRDRIAHDTCPRSVLFVDQLPRLETGKIARRLLPREATA